MYVRLAALAAWLLLTAATTPVAAAELMTLDDAFARVAPHEQGAAGARLQREDRCLICGRGRRPQGPDQPTVPCAGPARPGIPSLKI